MDRITEYKTDDLAGEPALYNEYTIEKICNHEKADIVCVPVAVGSILTHYAAYRISVKTREEITPNPAYSFSIVRQAIDSQLEDALVNGKGAPIANYEAFIKAFSINHRGSIQLAKFFRVLV